MMVNYLHRLCILIDYAETYSAYDFPGIKVIYWSKIIKDVRSNYRKGALKEQKVHERNHSNECHLSRSLLKCQTK